MKAEHRNFFPFEKIKSMETLLDIAHSVLIGLQIIHSQGYVYNALRPENIQISHQNKVQLVDFTKVKKYINSSGQHLSQRAMTVKTDNFLFPKTFNAQPVSRRDDLINMCYMMLYLFTNGKISLKELDRNTEINNVVQNMIMNCGLKKEIAFCMS